MRYNYYKHVRNDIIEAIDDYMSYNGLHVIDLDHGDLFDMLFVNDSVTGNMSGSYTFNSYEAQKNLLGNDDLLIEALNEFGYDECINLDKGYEFYDVLIRLSLITPILEQLMSELENNKPVFEKDGK